MPYSIAEVTAEIGVDGNFLAVEIALDVGTIATEALNRKSPLGWIWAGRIDVRWSTTSREMPNLNHVIRPFHSNDASAVVVETSTVGRGILVKNRTAYRIGASSDIIATVCSLN